MKKISTQNMENKDDTEAKTEFLFHRFQYWAALVHLNHEKKLLTLQSPRWAMYKKENLLNYGV